jgi:large subunit ribosomal protein L22
MKRYSAKLSYAHIAPRKVRLAADLVRNTAVEEALLLLDLSTNRAATPLAKLVRSAAQNVKNDQEGAVEKDMRIVELRVDQGPMLKRFRPVWRGIAHAIQKKTSHVTVVVELREQKKTSVAKTAKKKTAPKKNIPA